MNLKAKNLSGFSLIEVLLAIGIFGILSVVIANIFLTVMDLHRTTANLQRLQNEGRYIIEKISREIRSREIAYPIPEANYDNKLNFLKDESRRIAAICLDQGLGNLNYYFGPEQGSCLINGQALNAQDVEVVDIKFFALPTQKDRWTSEPNGNIHPRVTMLLTIRNRIGEGKISERYQKSLTFQTTVSSKYYKR